MTGLCDGYPCANFAPMGPPLGISFIDHILAQAIAGFILILGFYYAPQIYARLKVLAATEKAKRGK